MSVNEPQLPFRQFTFAIKITTIQLILGLMFKAKMVGQKRPFTAKLSCYAVDDF